MLIECFTVVFVYHIIATTTCGRADDRAGGFLPSIALNVPGEGISSAVAGTALRFPDFVAGRTDDLGEGGGGIAEGGLFGEEVEF